MSSLALLCAAPAAAQPAPPVPVGPPTGFADPTGATAPADPASTLAVGLADNAMGRFGTAASTDPAVRALLDWDRLGRPAYRAGFDEIAAFVRAHPGWPGEARLLARAEAAAGPLVAAASRADHLERYPPRTGTGAYWLADAHAALGRPELATLWARRAWASAGLPPALETDLLARFGARLGAEDHLARTDALLWAGATAAAGRMIAFLPADAAAWANARIALQTRAPDATVRFAAVPARFDDDPGLLLDRARWLEADARARDAWTLLAERRVAPGAARDPVRWMKARLAFARAAAKAGATVTAYRIASDHEAFALGRALNDRPFAERDAFTDIEWFAGWVALRGLNQPGNALLHFSRYQAGAQTGVTRAKGLYWAGRAELAAGHNARATALFAEASGAPETFYGQLAAERLGVAPRLVGGVAVGPGDRARWTGDPLIGAARLLGAAGARASQTLFLKAAADRAAGPGERAALAELAAGLGRPDLPVLAARTGRPPGEPWPAYAYPRVDAAAAARPDAAIVHAITRQESGFDRQARSGAGALGLMQLMQGTAREQADKDGLGFSVSRLTDDPDYNIALGGGYYARLLDRWAGNHVLAVASYNAGAGNVNRWIALNGDPRLPGADPLAWIEAIPFGETRTYVQRVLEGAVVYEAVLAPGVPRAAPLSRWLGKTTPG